MDVLASVRQPSTFRMLIWPEASNAQNSIAAVSADGSTVCVLIRRLNSSCRRSIALVVRALRHWLGGSRVKVKRRSPASSRLSANRPTLEPPLADEGLAAALDLRRCGGVNHVRVVGGDLLVQTLGRMGEQVPVLVHGAPLDRHAIPDGGDGLLQSLPAIHDQQLRPAQTTTDEIVENTAPSFAALPAHALDRE